MPDEQNRQGTPGIRPVWLAAGIGLCIAAALAPAAAAYLSTHPLRRRVRRRPEGFPGAEDVSFASSGGVQLSGWFLPCPDPRGGLVLCHGFPNNRGEMLWWARMLRPARCHVLAFDFRALGNSGGDLCSIGWSESEDVESAVDYMARRPEMRGLQIGVFGLSMGGAAAILAAARDNRISAVATHGAYARLDRAIHERARLFLGPLAPPVVQASLRRLSRWLPEDPRRIAPAEVISRIAPRPVLLLHGARDRIVNPEDGRMLYAAAREPKELVLLPRSWHARVHRADHLLYEQVLQSFFQTRLRPPDQA